MDTIKLLVELLAPIMWPLVIFTSVIILLCLFKEDISSRIRKTKRIAFGSFGMDIESSFVGNRENKADDVYKDARDSYTSPMAKDNKRNILKYLEESNLPVEQQNEVLINELSHQQMYVHYWFIRYWIGVERKKLLINMNSDNGRMDLSFKNAEIDKYYKQYVQRLKNDNTPPQNFESFLAFLSTNLLITQNTEGGWGITIKGNDFLTFLTRVRDPDLYS